RSPSGVPGSRPAKADLAGTGPAPVKFRPTTRAMYATMTSEATYAMASNRRRYAGFIRILIVRHIDNRRLEVDDRSPLAIRIQESSAHATRALDIPAKLRNGNPRPATNDLSVVQWN